MRFYFLILFGVIVCSCTSINYPPGEAYMDSSAGFENQDGE